MADGWADGAMPAAAGAAGAAESEEAKQKKATEALKQKIVASAKQMIEEKEKVRSPRGVGRVRMCWRPAFLPQARLGAAPSCGQRRSCDESPRACAHRCSGRRRQHACPAGLRLMRACVPVRPASRCS